MLPDRENSHCLQQATAWRQEGHRTLCPNPFHAHATLARNVTETTSNFTRGTAYNHTDQPPVPARTHSGPPRKISTTCPCILQAKAQIFGQYFGDILRERQRLFYMEWWHFWWTFIELILNVFCMNFNELFMNFEMYLKCIVLILCIDYCYVLYWFLLWILIDLLIDLMIWKIWLILLTCIAL